MRGDAQLVIGVGEIELIIEDQHVGSPVAMGVVGVLVQDVLVGEKGCGYDDLVP
ncbi:hypothetical protein [Mycobacterium sp. E2497]|uniref:hypothetical protein n=1 Tax=Mycobacterium sp. E2497 TaxID=1834135 RepID=UPI0018D2C25A|nr:hypothetical protein [Mycobacterium sp. E2497]